LRAVTDNPRKCDFSGKHSRELLGQRELDYKEAASVIGKAINKSGLAYTQLPPPTTMTHNCFIDGPAALEAPRQ
jgi:hypothetical protein